MTLFILGILGGLFHIAHSEVKSFEHRAGADIASTLEGSEKKVDVRANLGPEALWGDVHEVRITASRFTTQGLPMYTEPRRSRDGLLRELDIELDDFTLGGLHIDRLSAAIPDCRFDFPLAVHHRQIRLSKSGEGQGEVVIKEKDLEQFILLKYHEIHSVSVKLDRDKVFVEGDGSFLIFNTHFRVVAKLQSPDGDTLELAFAHILLDGREADEASKKALLDTLNPVVDLNSDLHLYGAIKVQSVELRDGLLRATGRTKIPNRPSTGR